MAKSNGPPAENATKSPAAPAELDADADAKWGTWEELLLACAVNRHGTNSWDAVAREIQKRSSSSSILLTPGNCQIKYLHLTRRFFIRNNKSREDDENGVVSNGRGDVINAAGDSVITTDESMPLLEELRKLRVAELRRELERYDLSIVTLQSKVEKMKEERERSTTNSEDKEENSSDLRKSEEAETPRERVSDEEIREVKPESEKSPLSVAGESISGKDEQSVNEPISADGRDGNLGTGINEGEKEEEPGRTGEVNEEPDRTGEDKPAREEDSCYGSSDSVEKEEPEPEPEPERVEKEVKVEPGTVSDSPELVESVAESKGGGEEEATTKECSDVQSSATKSMGGGDKDRMLRGSSNDNDLENDNRSTAVKLEASVESQPLIDFLENVKVHKLGSVFMRRLDSQDAPNYNSLIRQHVDLETVQTRIREGIYSDNNLKFFRDLLLLVNNALVFFGKNTPEFLAAIELRHLITNEMAQRNTSSDSSPEKQISLEKVSLPKKENSEPSESLLLKPKLGGPLIVCRKRSSIAAKASASSSASDKKGEQTTKLPEDRVGLNAKQQLLQPPAKSEEPRITKKRSRDRFASVSTSLKKNGKNGTSTNSKQTTPSILEKNQGKGGPSSQQLEPRCESKNNQSSLDLKKRSAANFLNRMKQSSSSNNGTLLDALKNAPLSAASNSKGGSEHKKTENGKGSGGSEQKKNDTGKGTGGSVHKKNDNGKGNAGSEHKKNDNVKGSGGSEHKKNEYGKSSGGSEHKKNDNAKGSGKKEQLSTRGSDAKQAKEKGSPAKKSLGRPMKKGAAPPPPSSGKRGRDGRESESVASKHQRKRSRK